MIGFFYDGDDCVYEFEWSGEVDCDDLVLYGIGGFVCRGEVVVDVGDVCEFVDVVVCGGEYGVDCVLFGEVVCDCDDVGVWEFGFESIEFFGGDVIGDYVFVFVGDV